MDAKEKRLRGLVAVYQAEADSDWKLMEEHLIELERAVTNHSDGLVKSAAGLVVTQIYLNGMRRQFEDLDYANGRSGQID